MAKNKEPEIVEKELWDHYSELPNPSWYEYIADKDNWIYVDEYRRRTEDNTKHQLYKDGKWIDVDISLKNNETFYKPKV